MDPFERVQRQGTVFADTELVGEMAELADNRQPPPTPPSTRWTPRGLVSSPDIDFNVPLERVARVHADEPLEPCARWPS